VPTPEGRGRETVPGRSEDGHVEGQIKKLADGVAYDVRSHTGHRGTLIGEEATLGYLDITLFQAPSRGAGVRGVFEVSIVADLRRACRRVLAKAFALAVADNASGGLSPVRLGH
jgi:hypothetical protein